MNQNVDHMIANQIVTVKIVVQRKADIGHRASGFLAVKSGPGKIFQTEHGNANMGVVADIA